MKIPKLVMRAFCVTIILLLVIGYRDTASAQDQQTVKQLQKLIEQQQKQLEAQQRALEAQTKALKNLQNRVETLSKEETKVEKKAVEAERLAEEATKKALAAKAEADKALRKAVAVDVENEADRHRGKGKSFHIPDSETVITLSGFVQGDVIHDFDKISSPGKFVAKDIVVDGQPSGEPSSRTTLSANPSRFIIASATPTDYGKLSTFVSMDFFGDATSAKPDPRLRQAWGQLDDFFWGGGLRGGQSWSTWDDVKAIPETMDFSGPNAEQ